MKKNRDKKAEWENKENETILSLGRQIAAATSPSAPENKGTIQ